MQKRIEEPAFFRNLKKYSIYYGFGAAGALQALKFDWFSLPPNVLLYFGWIFSVILLMCIFLAGGGPLVDMANNISDLIRKNKQADAKRKEEEEET